ncbi:nitrate reductase delta subunit [Methylohalomonas lacus]|uniref:Nitrate reductase delta subunit n=1 Tax=Methylohalomonas lacus TaxID=398773 RepID=A0AAE3HLB0_9GAMM|nr:nitrate reductase molybdenum cofactor assembly chaperone [Methylohalomonas lacus]MCS3903224.1 nitrate reductase delta subunit [Methylohalomonas lacus]
MSHNDDATLQRALKAIALLLHYPDSTLQAAIDEIDRVLEARPELNHDDRDRLRQLIARLRDNDILDLQAEYVATFDHSKKVSLYLFEHVYGESRDRGPAMVELNNAYREKGLAIDAQLLPDYLPLFLEFCAGLDEHEAQDWLADTDHVLQQIHVRLSNRDSPYALPLHLLLRLLQRESAPAELVAELSDEARDDTRAAYDQGWMEAPVTFGPDQPASGCGQTAGGRAQPVTWKQQPAGKSGPA